MGAKVWPCLFSRQERATGAGRGERFYPHNAPAVHAAAWTGGGILSPLASGMNPQVVGESAMCRSARTVAIWPDMR